ncbi:tRNA (adenosine(37)-N6)-threonylcarbamoyltransferase complex dimerization subunit type 1 TsaB [Thalassovita mangrovi]|uniref:tRNA (Adenosine(37)-N6)-threonylcarbamoyltransferase complex dimerization subunit type 1 TsaB n=1 Tax=Thalassovita mangrovi TaxID=2692236 RepID=A0A6L8LM24_9RHOB|nr:tRNA (adenosine(37)-N6)-threonylcarbamoyltransferase complex dimerization subunit type 1 TsaB [Thalassovita mangrovi]MYM57054.1 tRNA (adenosine(37)-N6)-threonylcarbamoyltransferase complex dimerization subunit type 1 TsaB [Thalassovita mangrovi]
MPSEPLVLGFDTSAAHCAAALLSGDRVIAARTEDMGRGQAERLMPLLEDVLKEAGFGWADLDAIGVGVGPGNFTGIRISVSAARGLALALDIPAIGVNSFEATSLHETEPHIPVVPAPRDQLYAAPAGEAPRMITLEDAKALDLPLLAASSPARLAENIARIAAARVPGDGVSPAPLYIKAADAAPPRDPAPVILSDDA